MNLHEALVNLMNCGFFIYQDGSKFVLRKEKTPADNRWSITNDVSLNTNCIYFDKYEDAFSKAIELFES